MALYYLGIGRQTGPGTAAIRAAGGKTAGKAAAGKQRGVPWFALGFAAVAVANSVVGFGPRLTAACGATSSALLASAMAALGLDADLQKVRAPREERGGGGRCACVAVCQGRGRKRKCSRGNPASTCLGGGYFVFTLDDSPGCPRHHRFAPSAPSPSSWPGPFGSTSSLEALSLRGSLSVPCR